MYVYRQLSIKRSWLIYFWCQIFYVWHFQSCLMLGNAHLPHAFFCLVVHKAVSPQFNPLYFFLIPALQTTKYTRHTIDRNPTSYVGLTYSDQFWSTCKEKRGPKNRRTKIALDSSAGRRPRVSLPTATRLIHAILQHDSCGNLHDTLNQFKSKLILLNRTIIP